MGFNIPIPSNVVAHPDGGQFTADATGTIFAKTRDKNTGGDVVWAVRNGQAQVVLAPGLQAWGNGTFGFVPTPQGLMLHLCERPGPSTNSNPRNFIGEPVPGFVPIPIATNAVVHYEVDQQARDAAQAAINSAQIASSTATAAKSTADAAGRKAQEALNVARAADQKGADALHLGQSLQASIASLTQRVAALEQRPAPTLDAGAVRQIALNAINEWWDASVGYIDRRLLDLIYLRWRKHSIYHKVETADDAPPIPPV